MNIGSTIRLIRKRKNLSQKDLAKYSNISQTYISQIESGKRTPSIEILRTIGSVLETPFQIISFLSLDEDSVPENKRDDFRRFGPSIKTMVEDIFLTE